mmetsp:Transcript_12769/g.19775  ORF Transcript_12769/g.19775 Transcript_12769/m.19775 type:complete len:214 (+) Transcript_12769:73-714(+)
MISTDWTKSSSSSIFSITPSTETFSSSRENPTMSLKIPKATGSFLYSVFQKRPSWVSSVNILLARSSRLMVSSRGLTSSITRDIATAFFFSFFFLASSLAFLAASLAASASSSSSSPKRSRSSSSSFFSTFFSAFLPLPALAGAAAAQEFLTASVNLDTRQNQANTLGWVSAERSADLRASKAVLSASVGACPPTHCWFFRVFSRVLASVILK